MLIVVNYHYVRAASEQSERGIHAVSQAQLGVQLRLLGTVGEFVSGQQVRRAVRGAQTLPSRAILVTFDDGLREQVENALPVLQQLGVPALFFVNTHPIAHRTVAAVHRIHLLRAHVPPKALLDLVTQNARVLGLKGMPDAPGDVVARHYPYDTRTDAQLKYALNFGVDQEVRNALIAACFRTVFGDADEAMATRLYMDVAQLRSLGAGDSVGTHGHEHIPLGGLSRAAARRTVQDSVELLTDWLGYRPYALSYPYGSQDACTLEAGAGAAEAGIEFAFTMERAGNEDLSSPLHLARFDCNDLPGGRYARLRIDDLFDRIAPAQWHRAIHRSAGYKERVMSEPGGKL
jgi:peptidoglycan/xylan/chitin deacetylase (PgdA/CDA1 family)